MVEELVVEPLMLLVSGEIRIKILNEWVEPDPELIGYFFGGVSRDEQLGHGLTDRVEAQLDAAVGA